jgi:hypothetical protein
VLTTLSVASADQGRAFDVPEPLLAVARIAEMQARDAVNLSLQDVTVARDQISGDRLFTVDLAGDEHVVTVRPYSIRDEFCQAFETTADGTLVPVELPAPQTYRGEVEGKPGMVVAARIDPAGRITALLHDPIGGENWAVEPLIGNIPGIPGTVHTIYRPEDLNPEEGVCGSTEDDRVMPGRGDAGFIDPLLVAEERRLLGHTDGDEAFFDGPEGGSSSQTQIAFDADYEYYQLNGFSTAATILDIETVMNAVGLLYQNQNGICYAATGYIVRTSINDPYTTSDSAALLAQFRDEWEANVTIPRDTAHLFTGREVDGTVIGRAFVGVICSSSSAYGFSQSQYTTDFTNRTQLTTHELGHNWNACHCNQSGCTGGDPDSDCGIMNSFVNGNLTFGSRSLATIEAHRSSRSCLGFCNSTTYVDADAGFIQNGSFTFPWDTWREGHDYAKILSTVRFRNGSYPETGTYSKPLTIDMDGTGSATIGD